MHNILSPFELKEYGIKPLTNSQMRRALADQADYLRKAATIDSEIEGHQTEISRLERTLKDGLPIVKGGELPHDDEKGCGLVALRSYIREDGTTQYYCLFCKKSVD
jgi:hypothetical protein